MSLKRRLERIEERLPAGGGECIIVDLPPRVERVPLEQVPPEERSTITVELVGQANAPE